MNDPTGRSLAAEVREEGAPVADDDPKVVSTDEGNPFIRYVGSDVLLSLQYPRTDAPAEPAFLIMTQVMELLFKLAHIEALRTRDQLESSDVTGALWTLRRLGQVSATLTGSWDVLGSLSPTEYAEFREQLGSGTGFQSFMYRQMEFLLGNKNAKLAEAHRADERIHRDLVRTLTEPSLYDAALRLLWRRGLPVPRSCVERDWSEPYEEQDAVVDAWHVVYVEKDKYGDLYQLAEALMSLAADLGQWRYTHLLTVERLLGAKAGTGGTTGANWLRRVADHRFFPELWMVRTKL
ncbi:tryptophan 2,3-dioxygenase [Nonomuraea sp. K274]|uniref:Tryptophan 2,3-dioxygenase n=1 Tax=Nonomuraea cypriaca TaxID=1187855 RepID=A0A931EXT2_9ACTN|nr:tryptophan 2,3-dioxygenase family protein [Nonomuraea cypriaca]MBF8184506.1 tryptophan 2,3-dioxygenase [Nonomuraea cypriaca]